MQRDFAFIFDKYSEEYYVSYDEDREELLSTKLIPQCNFIPFTRELMTTVYKNVSTRQVVKELAEFDSKFLIVKSFGKSKEVDKTLICKRRCKKMLDQAIKLLSTDETGSNEERISHYEKCKTAFEAYKNRPAEIITIMQPAKYIQYTDLIEKGRVDILETFLDSFREVDKASILESIPHSENKNKFLQACKQLFPNVKADNVHICANAVAEFVQKVYFNLGEATYNPQKMMFLYSMLGGTGKGVFMNRLVHFCETLNISVGKQANISTHWLSPEFKNNLISVIPEFFPFKSNMNEQIININNIIDNNEYIMELKGQQPISLKSNTTLICGSNKKPFDINDRRYNVVEYNNVQLFDGATVKKYKDFLHTEYTPEEWDKLFYDVFTSAPFNFKFNQVKTDGCVPENFADFVEKIRYLKESKPYFFTENHSIREIARELQINSDGKFIQSLSKEYRKEVLKNIIGLVDTGFIEPAVKINGQLEYSKYNLNKIAELCTYSDISIETEHLNDPIYETATTWDALISSYPDNNNPEGGNKNDEKGIGHSETGTGEIRESKECPSVQTEGISKKEQDPYSEHREVEDNVTIRNREAITEKNIGEAEYIEDGTADGKQTTVYERGIQPVLQTTDNIDSQPFFNTRRDEEKEAVSSTLYEKVDAHTDTEKEETVSFEEALESVKQQQEMLCGHNPFVSQNAFLADGDMNISKSEMEDYGLYAVDDKYSKPSTVITDKTQFLMTARFKKEYQQKVAKGEEELNRRSVNLIPTFFVYEMDELDKKLQYQIIDNLCKQNVFTITDSGNKSIHTLVLIDPSQAEDIAKDFKYYWAKCAERLYGKAVQYLDKACASVGRLTRCPGAIRSDTGKVQYCLYKNKNVQPIDLSDEIEQHSVKLEQKKAEDAIRYVEAFSKRQRFSNSDTDTIEHLRAAVHKTGNESGQLALDLIDGIDPGSGANYIAAIGYCNRAIGPEVGALVRNIAHRLHPSNIPRS